MQRTIKYIGWLIETKKPQDNNNNNKNRSEQTQNRKHYQKTETQIPKRKQASPIENTQKNTKLNHKTETESKNTNHKATKDENRNKKIV